MHNCFRHVEVIVRDRSFFPDPSLYIILKEGDARENLPINRLPYS